jgi:mercuric ion binding protein
MKKLGLGLALFAGTLPAWPAVQTVTLSVPGMSCPTCPITVKKALGQVPGVMHVKSSLEKRQSTVTFDDSKARIDDLINATEDAGYPSTLLSPAVK